MKKYNILVFPCGTEVANEIVNSLRNNKYFKLKYASSEGMSYCNFRNEKIHFLPYVTDNRFIDRLKEIIEKEKIDFIIPAHDDVAFILSQIEDDLQANVIGQSKHVNEIVRFKDKSYEYFKGVIPVASVYENEKDIVFPIFVKPKKGQGSQDSFLVKNQQEFEYFKYQYSCDDFVWMEYLDGDEFTIDCFSDNSNVLYAGARTREKTTRGISVLSSYVTDEVLNTQFQEIATIISKKMELHGIWFYQMKMSQDGQLKFLEIGPRVPGTMMLNRSRGVNFVELALFQKLGFPVEVVCNDIEITLGRALVPKYIHNLVYDNLYIDFDDTLFLDEQYINTELIKLIFQAKNENKPVFLITKNKKNNLTRALHSFGICNVFDGILHIQDGDQKSNYMKGKSLLIDDSFRERKEAIENGFYAMGNDTLDVLMK